MCAVVIFYHNHGKHMRALTQPYLFFSCSSILTANSSTQLSVMSTEHGIILYSFVVYHTEELRVNWLLKYVPFLYIQMPLSISMCVSVYFYTHPSIYPSLGLFVFLPIGLTLRLSSSWPLMCYFSSSRGNIYPWWLSVVWCSVYNPCYYCSSLLQRV